MEEKKKNNKNVKEEKNEATKDKSIDSKPKPEEIFSIQLFDNYYGEGQNQKEKDLKNNNGLNLNGYLQFCDSKYNN